MINVSVRKHDAADRRSRPLRGFPYAGRRTGDAGIDEGESIVFPDQKTIDHAEASQTEKIFRLLKKLHTGPAETQ
jgi:hypothetical protein